MEGAIRLYWTAEVEQAVVDHLRERLAEVFACAVQPGGRFELMPEEFHAGRQLYRSSPILRRLRPLRPARDYLLAITEADLFAAGLNFVFGEADMRGRCAIISLARLRAAYPDRPDTTELFLRRTLIEAVHELGHLLGLGHCPQPACVMHFSNTLADTDRKTPEFCPRCRELLE